MHKPRLARLLFAASALSVLALLPGLLGHTSTPAVVLGRYSADYFAFLVVYAAGAALWLGLTAAVTGSRFALPFFAARPTLRTAATVLTLAGFAGYELLLDASALGEVAGAWAAPILPTLTLLFALGALHTHDADDENIVAAAPPASRTAAIVSTLGAAALWLAAWSLPWLAWAGWSAWARAAVGLALFAVPGSALLRLLRRGEIGLGDGATLGFAISIALTGALGLIGRIAHLPFGFVMHGLGALGAAAILGGLLPGAAPARVVLRLPRKLPALLAGVVMVTVLAFAFAWATGHPWNPDDYAYGAYLTGWQHAAALDFGEVYFGLGHVDSARFWLALFPMVEAVLAEASGVAGVLLLHAYLRPLLAVIALLGVERLARALGLPPALSATAAVVQVVVLVWLGGLSQPGQMFFERLQQDKAVAAFILLPVLLRAAADYLSAPGRRRLAVVLLAALALLFTHPIILSLAGGVTVLFALLDAWAQPERTLRHAGAVAGMVALAFVGLAAIRLSGNWFLDLLANSYAVESAFDPDETVRLARLNVLPGGRFYGISPELLAANGLRGLWRFAPLALALLGTALGLARWRQTRAGRAVLAAGALLVAALVPYTGWLIGRAITVGQLWRVAWLFPFGLAAAFLTAQADGWLAERARWGTAARGILWAALSVVLLGRTLVALAPLPEFELEPSVYYEDLAFMGGELARLAGDGAITAGATQELNNFLPVLAPNAHVVAIRHTAELVRHGIPREEALARTAAVERITEDGTAPDVRLAALDAYRVEYLLAPSGLGWPSELAEAHPGRLEPAAEQRTLTLYRILPGGD